MSFATFWLNLTSNYVCFCCQKTAACTAHAPVAVSHVSPAAENRNFRCLTKNSHWILWQLRQAQTDLEAIWNCVSSWFSDTFFFSQKRRVYIFLWKNINWKSNKCLPAKDGKRKEILEVPVELQCCNHTFCKWLKTPVTNQSSFLFHFVSFRQSRVGHVSFKKGFKVLWRLT